MIRRAFVAVLAGGFIVASCASLVAPNVRTDAAALRAGQYELDAKHAAIVFKTDHLGFSKYVGRFDRFDASLDFDAADVSRATVAAVIDMTSIDVANDDFAKTLMGPAWFDVERFPQATFRSREVTATDEQNGRLSGDLTLRGVTRPISLDVIFNGGAKDLLRGGYVVGFSATGAISRKEFGVDKFEGLVGDDVRIEIEAEFIRR